ncbi:MAG: hypothetical protein ACFFFC_19800 [Candidatus Thorarchaeota archaeon]
MMKRATGAKEISPLTGGAITGIVALFGPVVIVFYSGQSFTVAAMAWLFHSGGGFGNFIFDINNLIASLPYTFLRIVFVWMIYRLYRGKTSLKRVAVIAIAAELQLPVIFLIQFLPIGLSYAGFPSMPLPIPIPLLVLMGFLLTRIAPPPDDEFWIEKEQIDYWWEEANE